jgi:Spy/CpxP family protein refolding chaperone
MKTRNLLAGVAASAVLAGGLALAEAPEQAGRKGHPGGRGPMEGLATYLGLTEEQKAQVAEHRQRTRPQAQALFTKVRENREKVRQALEAETPDPATVGALAIEGHELQVQMRAQREADERELRAMLTPEQQTKLDAMKALRGAGRRGPGGPMGGPMPFGPADDEAPPQE